MGNVREEVTQRIIEAIEKAGGKITVTRPVKEEAAAE